MEVTYRKLKFACLCANFNREVVATGVACSIDYSTKAAFRHFRRDVYMHARCSTLPHSPKSAFQRFQFDLDMIMLMKPLLPADDAAFHTSKILSTESILAPGWRLARVGHRRIKLNILMLISTPFAFM